MAIVKCGIILLILSFTIGEDDIPLIKTDVACDYKKSQNVVNPFGFLISPGFNAFHFVAPNLKCSWLLTAPKDKTIRFNFLKLNLGDCIEGILQVFDGDSEASPLLATFCEHSIGSNRFQSKTNHLFFKLKTGPTPYFTGYQLFFEHVQYSVCKSDEIRCRNELNCFSINEQCDGIDNCGDGTDEEFCDNLTSNLTSICGSPEIAPFLSNDRIVGGIAVIPNSWPWQASMRAIRLEPLAHQCGATLINSQWLITAAHCFREIRDSRYWSISFGKHRKLVHDKTEEIRYIDSIYIHYDYKGLETESNMTWLQRKENDIALVKLNAPVTINRYVQPVCLPENSFKIKPESQAFITGWGVTYGTGNDLVLKQAAVPIVARNLCQILYPYYQIGDKMICAGFSEGGHDACSGDSGGPLVQRIENEWQLIGVTSTGGVCGAEKEPGIYTEVSKYTKWIEETIAQHSNSHFLKIVY